MAIFVQVIRYLLAILFSLIGLINSFWGNDPFYEGRVIHDADSHIIEGRGWLESYASEYVKNNLDTGAFDLDMPALDPLI